MKKIHKIAALLALLLPAMVWANTGGGSTTYNYSATVNVAASGSGTVYVGAGSSATDKTLKTATQSDSNSSDTSKTYTFTAVAEPEEGYEFTGWTGGADNASSATTPVTVSLSSSTTSKTVDLTATFAKVVSFDGAEYVIDENGGELATLLGTVQAGDKIIINKDVTIEKGVSLTIPSGIQVSISSGKKLIVKGGLSIHTDARLVGEGALAHNWKTITQAADVHVPFPLGTDGVAGTGNGVNTVDGTAGKYLVTSVAEANNVSGSFTCKEEFFVTVENKASGESFYSKPSTSKPVGVLCTVAREKALNWIVGVSDTIYTDCATLLTASATPSASNTHEVKDTNKLSVLLANAGTVSYSDTANSSSALGFAVDLAGCSLTLTSKSAKSQWNSLKLVRFFNGSVTISQKVMNTNFCVYNMLGTFGYLSGSSYYTAISFYDSPSVKVTWKDLAATTPAGGQNYYGGGTYNTTNAKFQTTPTAKFNTVYWGTFASGMNPTSYLYDANKVYAEQDPNQNNAWVVKSKVVDPNAGQVLMNGEESTFADAIATAPANAAIVLQKDVELASDQTLTATGVRIDLNGWKLTGSNAIINNGDLEIIDVNGNGQIDVPVINNGTLLLSSAKYNGPITLNGGFCYFLAGSFNGVVAVASGVEDAKTVAEVCGGTFATLTYAHGGQDEALVDLCENGYVKDNAIAPIPVSNVTNPSFASYSLSAFDSTTKALYTRNAARSGYTREEWIDLCKLKAASALFSGFGVDCAVTFDRAIAANDISVNAMGVYPFDIDEAIAANQSFSALFQAMRRSGMATAPWTYGSILPGGAHDGNLSFSLSNKSAQNGTLCLVEMRLATGVRNMSGPKDWSYTEYVTTAKQRLVFGNTTGNVAMIRPATGAATFYATLGAAMDAVADGGTVMLANDCDATLTLNKAGTYTFDSMGFAYSGGEPAVGSGLKIVSQTTVDSSAKVLVPDAIATTYVVENAGTIKCGETKYVSIEAAVEASSGDTIAVTVTADDTETVTLPQGKTLTVTVNDGVEADVTVNPGEGSFIETETSGSTTTYVAKQITVEMAEPQSQVEVVKVDHGVTNEVSDAALVNEAVHALTGNHDVSRTDNTDKLDVLDKITVTPAKIVEEVVGADTIIRSVTFDVVPHLHAGQTLGEGQTLKFRLPVDAAATQLAAIVYHGTAQFGIYPVQTYNNEKFIEVTSADFSPYSYELLDGETSNPIAAIGTTGYASLAAAVAAASAGDTVTLLADVNLSSHARSASDDIVLADITLDLNGKTIRGFNSGVRYSGNNAVIKNGTFDFVAAEAKPNYALSIGSYADGAAKSTGMRLENLTVKGGINIDNADVTLTDVTIDQEAGTFYCLYVDEDNNASATFVSGTINAGANATAVFGVAKAGTGTTDGTLNVQGGTVNANGEKLVLASGNHIQVSGGSFDVAVPEADCAEGYIPSTETTVVDNVTYYTVKTGSYVAQIGTTKYETLAAAVAAASAGDTITILADDRVSLTSGGEIAIDKPLTITGPVDANGKPLYTIYGTPSNTGYNDVFVASSSGTVTISNLAFAEFGNEAANSVNGHAPIFVSANNNKVVLENLDISDFNRTAIKINGGEFLVKDCNINCATTMTNYRIGGVDVANAATGAFVGTTITNVGTSDPTTWVSAALELLGSGAIRVEDCEFTDCINGIFVSTADGTSPGSSAVTVANTTVEADMYTLSNDSDADGAVIAVQSGSFTGLLYASEDTGFAISGGMFDDEIPEEYCADGYIPGYNPETELYTVKQGAYVVRNVDSGVGYETLAAAVSAATAGDTIVLLADIADYTGTTLVSKSLTINGAGHSITAAAVPEGGHRDMIHAFTGGTSMLKVGGGAVTVTNITFNGHATHAYTYLIEVVNSGASLTVGDISLLNGGELDNSGTPGAGYGAAIHVNNASLVVKDGFYACTGGAEDGVFPFTGILPEGDAAVMFDLIEDSDDTPTVDIGEDLLLVGMIGAIDPDTAQAILDYMQVPSRFVPYTLTLGDGAAYAFTGASPRTWNDIIDYGKEIMDVSTSLGYEGLDKESTPVEVGLLTDTELADTFVFEDANFTVNGNGNELTGTIKYTASAGELKNVVLTSDTILDISAEGATVNFGEGVSFAEGEKVKFVIGELSAGQDLADNVGDLTIDDFDLYVRDAQTGNLVPVTSENIADYLPEGYEINKIVEEDGTTKDLVVVKKQYTISWLNDAGGEIDTTTVEHGEVPTHDDAVKADSGTTFYTFAGWGGTLGGSVIASIPAATADAAYYAVFTDGAYVAQIGTAKYASLAAAFAAAQSGDTIQMIADSAETAGGTVAAGKSVVLDLNGKAVSYTSAFGAAFSLISVNGSLTVDDTSADADGSIAITSTANLSWDYAVNLFAVGNGGSLTIEKGSYSVTTPSYGYAEYVIAASNNSGSSTVTINGGTFTGNNIDAVVRLHDQYGRSQPLNVTVNGGDFTLNGSQCDSVIWFDVQNSGSGTDNASAASLAINGGTFTSTSSSPALDLGHSVDASGLRVTVAGGAFKSNGYVIKTRNLSAAAIANVQLSGGIYSGDEYYDDLAKETAKLDTLCADKYACVANPDSATAGSYPWAVVQAAFTVIFQNYDGTGLQTNVVMVGEATPSYAGETPTKHVEGNGIVYLFDGWTASDSAFYAATNALPAIVADETFTAHFTETVSYLDAILWNGAVSPAEGDPKLGVQEVSVQQRTGTALRIHRTADEGDDLRAIGEADDDLRISWSTSDSAIATIDGDGLLTFHDLGTVTVTITVTDAFGNARSNSSSVTYRLWPENLRITRLDYENRLLWYDFGTEEQMVAFMPAAAKGGKIVRTVYCTILTATDLTASEWTVVGNSFEWEKNDEGGLGWRSFGPIDTSAARRFWRLVVTLDPLTAGETVSFGSQSTGN